MHTGLFQGSCIVKLQKPPFRKKNLTGLKASGKRPKEEGKKGANERSRFLLFLPSMLQKSLRRSKIATLYLNGFWQARRWGLKSLENVKNLCWLDIFEKRASKNCPSFFSVFSVAFVFFSSTKASFSAIYRLPLAQGETHLALISMAVVLLLARVLWVIISENRELRS